MVFVCHDVLGFIRIFIALFSLFMRYTAENIYVLEDIYKRRDKVHV